MWSYVYVYFLGGAIQLEDLVMQLSSWYSDSELCGRIEFWYTNILLKFDTWGEEQS